MVSGAPLAPRVVGSDAGLYSGVAILAAHPSRSLCVDWPCDLFETGRLQFATTYLNDAWVSGAVCYGYPEGKLHVNARDRTSDMLEFGLSRLLQSPGPRYFCGDWNFEPDALAITARLQQLGWREVQQLEHARTGAPVQSTCKGTSQKDVIWLSPELCQWFTGLTVHHDVFPDHSVLVASFHMAAAQLERFLWPCATPVEWNQVPPLPTPLDFQAGDPTERYQHLWQLREHQAKLSYPGWTSKHGGRASQTAPRRKVGWHAPLKTGRTKDFQPKLYGCDIQHSRWIKQLRRLQNFVRWSAHRSEVSSLAHQAHGFQLWTSILHSPGFCPSFAAWWPNRLLVCVGDPVVVPTELPVHEIASCILCAFHHEVRNYENLLRTARAQQTIAAHDADPHLIFKDVRRPPPEPVSTLVQPVHARVVDLDPDDLSLTLDRPVDLQPECPIFVGGKQVTLIHHDSDQLWVESLDGVQPTQTLSQSVCLGSLPQVFEAFHTQWRQRWCRHDSIPNSQWSQIVGFAEKALAWHPVAAVEVTPELILAETQRKKPVAATGLDGVSRRDILSSCPNTLLSLSSLYARAETSGEWPQQIVAGRVNALAKCVGAAAANQYRPIVVYSLVYRVWSSIQVRNLLDTADDFAHCGVYGNRRGCQASHLWRALLHEIEISRHHGSPLSGLMADLEKAYNSLPRWPIVVAALRVGAPHAVLTAWCGAMATMQRRFRVRDSYSSGFLTSTGLAEGDALSCYGMLLLDHMLALWLEATNPKVRVFSYVDDWSFITHDADASVKQLDLALQFCSMCDLSLDLQKTFAWSVDPAVRAQLRSSGVQVRHFARDLGAHVAFSKQFTNSTVKDRFVALDQFWSSLRASKASYGRKIIALKMVGLPRGLYGISSAPIGASVWLALRRKATAALGMKRAGVNPLLLLGMVESWCDPQLVAVLHTCRDTREFLPSLFWDDLVVPFSCGLVDLPPNAPSLVDRLSHLGVVPELGGFVRDCFGSVNLLGGNYAELQLRLHWQWQHFVTAELAHRPAFRDLWRVDCSAVRAVLGKLSSDKRTLYRISLTGGFYKIPRFTGMIRQGSANGVVPLTPFVIAFGSVSKPTLCVLNWRHVQCTVLMTSLRSCPCMVGLFTPLHGWPSLAC